MGLSLIHIYPSDEARKQRQRLTEEEQNEMHRYEDVYKRQLLGGKLLLLLGKDKILLFQIFAVAILRFFLQFQTCLLYTSRCV